MDPFDRSRSWLLGVGREADLDSMQGVETLLRAVVGLWLCGTNAPSQKVSIVGLLNRLERASTIETSDPDLFLLTQGIARSLDLHISLLERFGDFQADELPKDQPLNPELVGRAVLLARLGYRLPPRQPLLDEDLLGRSPESLLGAKAHELRAACHKLSSATHFGLLRPDGDAAFLDEVRVVLSPLLLQVLRGYNVELGAALLRTLLHLRTPRTRAIRLATTFVHDQQQVDGKFGYYEIEVAAGEGKISFSPVADLYLPATVSSLWTLAETLIPGFRLYALTRANRSQRGRAPSTSRPSIGA